MSFTNPTDDKDLVPGDRFYSPSSKYLLESFLGQGSFGKVAKCVRLKDQKTVAIKMMKNISRSLKEANHEVSIMAKLKSLDPEKSNIIQWHEIFIDKGHICLEFEHLDKSLFDFMKARHFQPLPLKEIRPIVYQLANALNHLKSIEIIHADIKWENVMLVDQERNPFKVKLIDFGLASKVSDAKLCSQVQTRPYRSPEVILGLPFNEAIDMWSLGCLAASLYLGALLYPGLNEHDMIRRITATQGPLPSKMLTHGQKTSCFFHKLNNSGTTSWKLKEFQLKDDQKERRTVNLSSLDELLTIWTIKYDNWPDKLSQNTDVATFVEMIKGMLQLDPTQRMTPSEALEHRFICLSNIAHLESLSPHVRSSFGIMAAVRINSCPSTSSQTTNAGKSGMKRCFDTEDGKGCGTIQPSKRVKTTPCDSETLPKVCAAQSASCSSSQTQTCISQTTNAGKSGMKRCFDVEDGKGCGTFQPSKRVKTTPYDRNALPKVCAAQSASCSSSQTQTCISQTTNAGKSGMKRCFDLEDGKGCGTFQPSKRVKTTPYDRNALPKVCAAQSASCSSSQTQTCISQTTNAGKSGMKRCFDAEDGKGCGTIQPSKRVKTTPCDGKMLPKVCAAQSASCSSSQTQTCISQTTNAGKSGMKRCFDVEDGKGCGTIQPYQRVKTTPYDRKTLPTQTQTCISPSVKRKRTDEEETGHKEK